MKTIVHQARRHGSALFTFVIILGFFANDAAAQRRGRMTLPPPPTPVDSTPMIDGLNKALKALAETDRDYNGHREKAINHIHTAIRDLELPTGRGKSEDAVAKALTGTPTTSQADSDASLLKAGAALFAVHHKLEKNVASKGQIHADAQVARRHPGAGRRPETPQAHQTRRGYRYRSHRRSKNRCQQDRQVTPSLTMWRFSGGSPWWLVQQGNPPVRVIERADRSGRVCRSSTRRQGHRGVAGSLVCRWRQLEHQRDRGHGQAVLAIRRDDERTGETGRARRTGEGAMSTVGREAMSGSFCTIRAARSPAWACPGANGMRTRQTSPRLIDRAFPGQSFDQFQGVGADVVPHLELRPQFLRNLRGRIG